MIENYDSVDVFVGVDVGNGEHHAVALDRAGKVFFDMELPNDEGKMRTVLQKLKQSGTVLVSTPTENKARNTDRFKWSMQHARR